jgi:hypothetical protein
VKDPRTPIRTSSAKILISIFQSDRRSVEGETQCGNIVKDNDCLYAVNYLFVTTVRAQNPTDPGVVAGRGRMTDSAGAVVNLYSSRLYRHLVISWRSSLRRCVHENSERNSTSLRMMIILGINRRFICNEKNFRTRDFLCYFVKGSQRK